MGARATYGDQPRRFVDVRHVRETGSTNADLMALARSGAPDGVVLVADHQTGGRGRLGRSWEAPPGSSLLMSVLFRPGLAVADTFHLTMAVGLAAQHACEATAGVRPGLKWPNDLVVERDGATRKLGGILAESHLAGDRVDAVVVGLGLNVNWPREPAGDLAEVATALNLLTGSEVDRDGLLSELLAALDALAADLDSEHARRALRATYRDELSTHGRAVRVETPEGMVEGNAFDVDDTGSLVVDTADGHIDVAVGDVVHLRLRE